MLFIIGERALKNKILKVVDTRLEELKLEMDCHARFIALEMPDVLGECCGGSLEITNKLADISSEMRLSSTVMARVYRMKELVAKSEEAINTGNLILYVLGLQD